MKIPTCLIMSAHATVIAEKSDMMKKPDEDKTVFVTTTITARTVGWLDSVRGEIPRSRIIERAIKHYLTDIENGKEDLLPRIEKVTTMASGERVKHKE
jgi:hypothetical protein